MDFTLNDAQRQLQLTLRRFVEREVMPVASEYEHADAYPDAIVTQMAESIGKSNSLFHRLACAHPVAPCAPGSHLPAVLPSARSASGSTSKHSISPPRFLPHIACTPGKARRQHVDCAPRSQYACACPR